MTQMTPQEKVRTCLDYIDNRLETTSQQTIQIAEMMMQDIREFNETYVDAVKNNTLAQYTDQVRNTQLKWMSQLQDIIIEQTSRDLSGQVILALQKFTDKLDGAKLKNIDFELPSAVASNQADALDYMSQEDIDALMNNGN